MKSLILSLLAIVAIASPAQAWPVRRAVQRIVQPAHVQRQVIVQKQVVQRVKVQQVVQKAYVQQVVQPVYQQQVVQRVYQPVVQQVVQPVVQSYCAQAQIVAPVFQQQVSGSACFFAR